MKRVFEGTVDNDVYLWVGKNEAVLIPGLVPLGSNGKRVRITVEDLSESKTEPGKTCANKKDDCFCGSYKCKDYAEKNCGNCDLDRNKCTVHERKYGCDAWQPKAAEPQEWEQRFDAFYSEQGHLYDNHMCSQLYDATKSFIRAEIERVREEEKQAVVAFLRGHWLMTDGLAPMVGDIEQNKHGGGG